MAHLGGFDPPITGLEPAALVRLSYRCMNGTQGWIQTTDLW